MAMERSVNSCKEDVSARALAAPRMQHDLLVGKSELHSKMWLSSFLHLEAVEHPDGE